MAYEYIWEDNGLYRVFTGTTSGTEVLNSNLSIHGDPRFDEIDYVLNDFLSIDNFEVSDMDIKKIAHMDSVAELSKPTLKIAIITTHSELLEWVNKYLMCMKDATYICNIFSNIDDARQWCTA